MENGVLKKIYYQLCITEISPLRIGDGGNEETDSDLMLDGRGFPFIPGSSLAGILRSEAAADGIDRTALTALFGDVETDGEEDPEKPSDTKNKKVKPVQKTSMIFVGDAVLPQSADLSTITVSRRDGVAVDEWGMTVPRAKYDFQTAECRLPYTAVLEWSGTEKEEKNLIDGILEPILRRAATAGLSFGARTTRGFGRTAVKVKKRIFVFPGDLEAWLRFKPDAEDAFEGATELSGTASETARKRMRIEIGFRVVGTFSVRVKTMRSELDPEDGTVPDSIPLENARGNPVIPGTTWAGVFRHHMAELLSELEGDPEELCRKLHELNLLFGMDDTAERKHVRSPIRFSESEVVTNGRRTKRTVTRNALDRFTQAPRNGALFTSKVYSGGCGTLEIEFEQENVKPYYKRLLAASVADMHRGIVAVGGEAGVGRGILCIDSLKVNGAPVSGFPENADGTVNLNWLEDGQ